MTPQEKKRLSYLKDRRNTYRENDKASRKNIPRRKRERSRAERRIARRGFVAGFGAVDPERMDEAEVRWRVKRRKAWIKDPDRPLGEVLQRRMRWRAQDGMIDPAGAERVVERIDGRH